MSLNVSGLNFVTSDSGLLVPTVTSNPAINGANVTFDLSPATTDGWVITTEAGVVGWAPIPPPDPADATQVWMPLADADGILVLDTDGNIIPTLIPL